MANELRQVIQYLDNDIVRVFTVKAWHEGTADDPLTTVEISGYKDYPMYANTGN